jgi:hypothetical protein
LASGRYTETEVELEELVRQGRMLRGFWVGLAQLPRSHPFTVRRLERLYRIGPFHADVQAGRVPERRRLPRPHPDRAGRAGPAVLTGVSVNTRR